MSFTKEDIISLPNPSLRSRSKRVGPINAEIKQVVENMISATLSWDESREHEVGVALAAIQIDQAYRIVVIRNDFNNKEDKTFKVFINPEITKYEGDQVEDFEGCLSVPDIYGKVRRFDKVRIKAMDIDGEIIKVTADGFLARVFQHEIDHLNGLVFIDHIKTNPEAFYHLETDGKLKAIDYESIKDDPILWQ